MFYVVKRLLQGLLTLLLASMLSFAIIQLAPGDYLDSLRQNPTISTETIEQLKIRFGLDKPAIIQYWLWLKQVITVRNFGESFVYSRSVSSLILERVPATLLLAFSSIIVTWTIALPLGIISAVKQNTVIDKILRVISYIGQGFPSFITALIFLIIAQNLSPLFPVGGMTSIDHPQLPVVENGFNFFIPFGIESFMPLVIKTIPIIIPLDSHWYKVLWEKSLDIGWHMILPTLALSITSFAGLQRLTRGQLLDVLRQDYIQTARAKGLSENKIIYVHALRNAINPLVTLLGFEFASLLSGSFIAEYFFNWPGLGRLILQAVQAQDLYLVMASLMMSATMLIIGNLFADILLSFIDPRIRLSNLDSNG